MFRNHPVTIKILLSLCVLSNIPLLYPRGISLVLPFLILFLMAGLSVLTLVGLRPARELLTLFLTGYGLFKLYLFCSLISSDYRVLYLVPGVVVPAFLIACLLLATAIYLVIFRRSNC